jgi:hypothetical protein
MARKPDVLCAGACGKLLFGGGPTSLPPGRRMCRTCRAAKRTTVVLVPQPPLPEQACEWCSALFVPRRQGVRRFCSQACRRRAKESRRTRALGPVVLTAVCIDCGNRFEFVHLTGRVRRRCDGCRDRLIPGRTPAFQNGEGDHPALRVPPHLSENAKTPGEGANPAVLTEPSDFSERETQTGRVLP